jgi:hypothetical protein
MGNGSWGGAIYSVSGSVVPADSGYRLKNIQTTMSPSNIVAIAIALIAVAVILLSLALAREIASQRGSTLRVESEIPQKTSPWWTPIAIVLTIVFFVVIAYRNLGIPVPIWIWIWIPGWAGTLYGQHRGGRRYPPPPPQSRPPSPAWRSDSTPFSSTVRPTTKPAAPSRSSPRQSREEAELIRLLHGDREQAQRLIQSAGSADRALHQLLRDRQ